MVERTGNIYVFSPEAVRKSLASLLKSKNHEHVPGYLALLRSPNRKNGLPSPLSDIVEVYDRYLKVLDAGDDRPYLRPFVSRGSNIWFNDNVSGSYAPSNVKAEPGMFFKVVNVSGSGLNTTYSLPVDHAARASEHLLKGHKLPVLALAAFIYRDYGFELDVPSIAAVEELFRKEFGIDDTPANETLTFDGGEKPRPTLFDTLFYDDADDFSDADLKPL